MKKKESWRQDTPAQQLVACNQNVLGHIGNLKMALSERYPSQALRHMLERALPSMERSAQDVMDLHHWMSNDWEETK